MNPVLRIASAMLRATVRGAVRTLFQYFGPDAIRVLIRNDWHILPMFLATVEGRPWSYPEWMTREEIQRMEEIRRSMAPVAGAVLTTLYSLAKVFPEDEIRRGLDGAWLRRRLRETLPEILRVIDETPGGDKWLEEEARLWREFLLASRRH